MTVPSTRAVLDVLTLDARELPTVGPLSLGGLFKCPPTVHVGNDCPDIGKGGKGGKFDLGLDLKCLFKAIDVKAEPKCAPKPEPKCEVKPAPTCEVKPAPKPTPVCETPGKPSKPDDGKDGKNGNGHGKGDLFGGHGGKKDDCTDDDKYKDCGYTGTSRTTRRAATRTTAASRT